MGNTILESMFNNCLVLNEDTNKPEFIEEKIRQPHIKIFYPHITTINKTYTSLSRSLICNTKKHYYENTKSIFRTREYHSNQS